MKKNYKVIFNKEYIETFAIPVDDDVLEEFQGQIGGILDDCTKTLQKNSVNILDHGLLMVGDSVSGCEFQNSEFDIFVVLRSPKLELNTVDTFNKWYKKFKQRLKYAWEHRNDNKKLSRRKRKKQKMAIEKNKNPIESPKYNYNDFCIDYLKQLTNYFGQTTQISRNNIGLRITGRDELIMPVNVYIALSNDNSIKVFNNNSYKFITIDFNKRYYNIGTKIDETNQMYRNVLRVYNSLYYHLMEERPNMILLESVLYNCPNNLFIKDDVYQTFLNTTNYLFVKSIFQMRSICDENKNLLDESLCKNQISKFTQFLKILKSSLER